MPASSPVRSIPTTAPAPRLEAALVCLLLAACGPVNPPPLNPDGGARPDGGGGGGSAWTRTIVDVGGMGHYLRAAAGADGRVGAAWWSAQGRNDGLCEELAVTTPPDRVRWTLRYGIQQGEEWQVETVAEPLLVGAPRGVDLRFGPDGVPAIAAHAGEPIAQLRYCGANDAGFYRRTGAGTWSLDTAAATSGQAASGLPASDYGQVVGDWPALAFDPAGNPAIAYKDIHAGGMQSDDWRRADLELAWRQGGSWRHLPVDVGEGGGSYSALVFDGSGRPVIVHHVSVDGLTASRHGIWATRSDDGGSTWMRVHLHVGATEARPSVLLHPTTGILWVAWYDAVQGLPRVARLVDEDAFEDVAAGWVIERIGDPRYDEGYHPTLAAAPDGRVALAYGRCARAVSGLGNCTPAEDGVVLAWEDGGEWTYELANAGGEGSCGSFPSLAFDGRDRAIIIHQCTARTAEGFDVQVVAAVREPLP